MTCGVLRGGAASSRGLPGFSKCWWSSDVAELLEDEIVAGLTTLKFRYCFEPTASRVRWIHCGDAWGDSVDRRSDNGEIPCNT